MIVMNFSETISPMIIPLKREIISELYKRESEIAEKSPLFPNINLGFYQESGKYAMHKRGTMARFFHYDNMVTIQP